MKLLIVTRALRARSFDTLFSGLTAHFDTVDIHKLDKQDVHDIKAYLARTDMTTYDRVLFDIPLRRIGSACGLLRTIRGLVFYEEDSCQEFVSESKYNHQFSRDFAKLEGARIIVTSYHVCDYLIAKGIDAYCIPKAYDDRLLTHLGVPRDIDSAFVGRVKSKVYNERRTFLQNMEKECSLQMLRTTTPEEYLQVLNRISVFVSADIGFNEYMAKNFEALACGCLLMAKRQPSEDARLGFVDMKNVVHYDDFQEAIDKYRLLESDPERAASIAREGLELVQARHALSMRVDDFAGVIQLPAKALPIVNFGVMGKLIRLFSRRSAA